MTPATGPRGDDDRVVLAVRAAHDLTSARAAVTDRATTAGIDPERSDRIALAVSEIATNALVHADSTAHLEIITTDDWFVVEISDQGPGLPSAVVTERPAADEERGRGLWLVERLCDRVEVASNRSGARVSLYLRR